MAQWLGNPRTIKNIKYLHPKTTHPLEKTGTGKVMEVVVTMGHLSLRDWVISRASAVIKTRAGAVSYIRTNFNLSASEEIKRERERERERLL
jgi:hypothetical protein